MLVLADAQLPMANGDSHVNNDPSAMSPGTSLFAIHRVGVCRNSFFNAGRKVIKFSQGVSALPLAMPLVVRFQAGRLIFGSHANRSMPTGLCAPHLAAPHSLPASPLPVIANHSLSGRTRHACSSRRTSSNGPR